MSRELLISFDADQTLFDFDRVLNEALIATSSYLSHYSDHPITPSQLHRAREDVAQEVNGKPLTLIELRRQSFLRVLGPMVNAEELAAHALDVFKKVRFSQPHFFPYVVDTLATLKTRYKTALITNGNSSPAKAGISHLFDVIVMAEDHPFAKPDPRLFSLMLEQAQTKPHRLIHVGDSLKLDVAPANAIGATSIWFNPQHEENDTTIEPCHEIVCMRELHALAESVARDRALIIDPCE